MQTQPVDLSTLIFFGIALVFNSGVLVTQFWYVKKNMVTKDKMTISLLQLRDVFVTRDECAAMLHSKANGSSRHHSAGS